MSSELRPEAWILARMRSISRRSVEWASAIFTAQLWGRRDLAGIRQVLGIGLLLSLACQTLVSLLLLIYWPFPGVLHRQGTYNDQDFFETVLFRSRQNHA